MSLRGGAPWLGGVLAAGSRHYALDDGAIHSSELIRKAWNRAGGTPLGALTTLGKLNWRPHEAVIRRIENGGLPLHRQMIPPLEVTCDPRVTEILRQGLSASSPVTRTPLGASRLASQSPDTHAQPS